MAAQRALIAYAMQMIAYIVLKRRFAHVERPFVSPLGAAGAWVALVISLVALVTLFINSDFRQGVIGVALWFLAGLGYFGLYARKRIVRSPEETFAIQQRR